MGSRLLNYFCKVTDFNITETSVWSDSKVVLAWIQCDHNCWSTFTCNRLTEIKSYTAPFQWKHCPGKDNPADHLSRGIKVIPLLNYLRTKPWRHMGGGGLQIHIFLTLVLAGVNSQLHALAALYLGDKAPSTHWIGGWVGTRAGLDDVEKRIFLTLPGLELRHLGRPARSQSLYWLHYPSFVKRNYTWKIEYFESMVAWTSLALSTTSPLAYWPFLSRHTTSGS
jgi:hypothetical protein